MSISHATALITVEQFLEMDFEEPVELVRGKVVPKYRWREPYSSQAYGSVCARITSALMKWADAGQHGQVAIAYEQNLRDIDSDITVRVDVAFFPNSVLSDGKFDSDCPPVIPSVCAMVFQPEDCFAVVMDRFHSLLSAGVNEVWLVDISSRLISVNRPHHDMGHWSEDSTLKSTYLPGFEVPLRDFFSGIERPAPDSYSPDSPHC
jgi:Putative restriction endonuclease